MKYAVIIEKGEDGYGAYVPDLPGCIAAGDTKDEVIRRPSNSISKDLEKMGKLFQNLPQPSKSSKSPHNKRMQSDAAKAAPLI
jgi:predicted RNase H-like HicB family nuclease